MATALGCGVCRVSSRRASVVVDIAGLVDGLPVCARCLSTSTNAWAAVGLRMATRGAPAAGTTQAERGVQAGGVAPGL